MRHLQLKKTATVDPDGSITRHDLDGDVTELEQWTEMVQAGATYYRRGEYDDAQRALRSAMRFAHEVALRLSQRSAAKMDAGRVDLSRLASAGSLAWHARWKWAQACRDIVEAERGKTRVVSMRGGPRGYDVRIDRRSPWGNPYKLANDTPGDRENALRCYAHWLGKRSQAWLLDRVGELQGLRLGCWCAPKLCHGDVLALLADGVTDDPKEAAELAIRAWQERQAADSEEG